MMRPFWCKYQWCYAVYKYMPFTMTSVSSQPSSSGSPLVDIMRRMGLCFQERRRHVIMTAKTAVIKRPSSKDNTAPLGRSAYPSWSRISKAKWLWTNRYCWCTPGSASSECDSQACWCSAECTFSGCIPCGWWIESLRVDSLPSDGLCSFPGS